LIWKINLENKKGFLFILHLFLGFGLLARFPGRPTHPSPRSFSWAAAQPNRARQPLPRPTLPHAVAGSRGPLVRCFSSPTSGSLARSSRQPPPMPTSRRGSVLSPPAPGLLKGAATPSPPPLLFFPFQPHSLEHPKATATNRRSVPSATASPTPPSTSSVCNLPLGEPPRTPLYLPVLYLLEF
jgi:hypothetical protein